MGFNEYVGFKKNNGVRVSLDSIDAYPFHLHKDVLELVGLLYGRAVISDCATDHVLMPGDVYIFNPNDPHRIVAARDSGFITIQILRSAYLQQLPHLNDLYFVCQPYEQKDGESDTKLRELRFFMAKIWQADQNVAGGEQAVSRTTERMLQTLLEDFTCYTYKKDDTGALEIVRQPAAHRDASAIKRYYDVADQIYARFRTDLRLTDLASEIYVSPAHLSRSLKATVGLSFSEMLSLARSEEAERLLFATRMNVDEIAREVGFANRKHLAINFRKWYKKTPTEFRSTVQKDRIELHGPKFGRLDENRAKKALEGWLDGK
jgi:xylan 1,4-beta-xylosidase